MSLSQNREQNHFWLKYSLKKLWNKKFAMWTNVSVSISCFDVVFVGKIMVYISASKILNSLNLHNVFMFYDDFEIKSKIYSFNCLSLFILWIVRWLYFSEFVSFYTLLNCRLAVVFKRSNFVSSLARPQPRHVDLPGHNGVEWDDRAASPSTRTRRLARGKRGQEWWRERFSSHPW